MSQNPTQPQIDRYSELHFSYGQTEAQLGELTYSKVHS